MGMKNCTHDEKQFGRLYFLVKLTTHFTYNLAVIIRGIYTRVQTSTPQRLQKPYS